MTFDYINIQIEASFTIEDLISASLFKPLARLRVGFS